MKKRQPPIDLGKVRLTSLSKKRHKVTEKFFAEVWKKGGTFSRFFDSLPDLLASKDLKDVAARVADAVLRKRIVLIGMGGHAIKVGLSPLLIEWMEKGILKGIAMNGAGVIHDVEIAMTGHTSEEVDAELSQGTFGMVRETQETINHAIVEGSGAGWGIGESVGRKIFEGNFPFKHLSLLASGHTLGIPITVHVAIGTDINHMGPSADGASLGEGSLRDFHTFVSLVSELEKGVYINLGSAVILPEVFLKAVGLARNLGYPLADFTTVNMDFIQHYRPTMNVVERPTRKGGKGYTLIGHHEIMFPLLSAAVFEKLK